MEEVRPPTAAKHCSGGFPSLSSASGDWYQSKCRFETVDKPQFMCPPYKGVGGSLSMNVWDTLDQGVQLEREGEPDLIWLIRGWDLPNIFKPGLNRNAWSTTHSRPPGRCKLKSWLTKPLETSLVFCKTGFHPVGADDRLFNKTGHFYCKKKRFLFLLFFYFTARLCLCGKNERFGVLRTLLMVCSYGSFLMTRVSTASWQPKAEDFDFSARYFFLQWFFFWSRLIEQWPKRHNTPSVLKK
jgi:hypothetical protein